MLLNVCIIDYSNRFIGAHLLRNSTQRLTGTSMAKGPERKEFALIMGLIVCAVLDLWL